MSEPYLKTDVAIRLQLPCVYCYTSSIGVARIFSEKVDELFCFSRVALKNFTDLPNFLKKIGHLLCLWVHLQLFPVNLAPTFFSPPWECTRTQCTPWIRLYDIDQVVIIANDLTRQITKKTALMAAASRGLVQLCRALLSTGSRVDDVTEHVTFTEKQLQKNKLQETRAGTHAVHEAAKGAHIRVLQVLWSRDLEMNLYTVSHKNVFLYIYLKLWLILPIFVFLCYSLINIYCMHL